MSFLPFHYRRVAYSALVAAFWAIVLLATSPGLPMVWDEGNAILRAEQIPQHWQYTTCEEGHPALYGIVIALGQTISGAWLAPLQAARFGPIMLFALSGGAMFYRMARDFDLVAAVASVGALMLMPRVFAHAHFASFDGPLTSCWILAWAAFPRALTADIPAAVMPKHNLPALDAGLPTPPSSLSAGVHRRVSWLALAIWGVTLGMTLSCKATGWLAPLPFLLCAALYRERAAVRVFALGLPIALATFFLLNPPLWHAGWQGWTTFFRLNFQRAAQPGLNISTQFFGRMYNLDHSLPWYNTLVWTAITVPLGTLLLAGAGVFAALRGWRQRPAAMLLLANWLVLPVVRALPGTPPHDAERLFLPSFAFLAALAGVGCAAVLSRAATRVARLKRSDGRGEPASTPVAALREQKGTVPSLWRPRSAWCPAIKNGTVPQLRPLLLVAALYAGSASSLCWYAPQWLSYYNLLIGGLPGATALGMEPTYYWDALDDSVLAWLHAHTAKDEKIYFAAAPPENLALLRRWNVLRRATDAAAPGTFRWHVLQRRPSGLQPADTWLIEHARPAYRKTIRPGGFGPWRLDVPLLEVYSYRPGMQGRPASVP